MKSFQVVELEEKRLLTLNQNSSEPLFGLVIAFLMILVSITFLGILYLNYVSDELYMIIVGVFAVFISVIFLRFAINSYTNRVDYVKFNIAIHDSKMDRKSSSLVVKMGRLTDEIEIELKYIAKLNLTQEYFFAFSESIIVTILLYFRARRAKKKRKGETYLNIEFRENSMIDIPNTIMIDLGEIEKNELLAIVDNLSSIFGPSKEEEKKGYRGKRFVNIWDNTI